MLSALVSCGKAERLIPSGTEDVAITFIPVNRRLQEVSKAAFGNENSFISSAYFLPDGENWDNHNSTPELYLDNVTVSYSNGAWRTSPTAYWPKSGSLTFFAYSPADISGVSIDENGVSITDYSIQGDSDDILVADPAKDKTFATNGSGVAMQFRHKLARIKVKVKAEEVNSIQIKKIILKNIYTQGSLSADQWIGQTSLKNITFLAASANSVNWIVPTQTETQIGQTFSVMPQTLGAGQNTAELEIVYRRSGELSDSYANFPLKDATANSKWLKNQDITYLINMSFDYIEFSAETQSWMEEPDYGINIGV